MTTSERSKTSRRTKTTQTTKTSSTCCTSTTTKTTKTRKTTKTTKTTTTTKTSQTTKTIKKTSTCLKCSGEDRAAFPREISDDLSKLILLEMEGPLQDVVEGHVGPVLAEGHQEENGEDEETCFGTTLL